MDFISHLPLASTIAHISKPKTSGINLFNGDAMKLIKKLPNDSIDFAILDPNYDDWDELCKKGLIKEVLRVTKPTGNIICFTQQPFDFNLRKHINPVFRRKFCWSYDNGKWWSNRLPIESHQDIFLLTHSPKVCYFQSRTGLPYNSATRSFLRSSYSFVGYNVPGKPFVMSPNGKWMQDHYHIKKNRNSKVASKPKKLLEIFIRCLCPSDGVVLDPFFGSGVVSEICDETNRPYIGFEIAKNVFDNVVDKHQKKNPQKYYSRTCEI